MAQVNLDTASRLDIICRKGDTFELGVDFGVENIGIQGSDGGTGWGEWRLQVRTSERNEDSTIYNTTYSSNGVIDSANSTFDFTISDGDATGSKLTITAPANEMVTSGEYVYDLQHTASGIPNRVKTYLYGKFTVVEDVTNG